MRLKIIAILVVCIFLTLSILDTPEYVHCINLDLPGSIGLHATVFNILKVKIISKACNMARDNFISILENSIDNKEYFLPLILLYDHLSTFLTVCRNSDLKYPLHPITILIEENAVPEITKIIGISIIRS